MVSATVEPPVPEPQAAPGDRTWMDEILAMVMNPEVAPNFSYLQSGSNIYRNSAGSSQFTGEFQYRGTPAAGTFRLGGCGGDLQPDGLDGEQLGVVGLVGRLQIDHVPISIGRLRSGRQEADPELAR